jgi:hypothetical protein
MELLHSGCGPKAAVAVTLEDRLDDVPMFDPFSELNATECESNFTAMKTINGETKRLSPSTADVSGGALNRPPLTSHPRRSYPLNPRGNSNFVCLTTSRSESSSMV